MNRGKDYDYIQAAKDVARQSKVCTICGVDKPFSEFSARKGHPTGKVPHCKACCSNRIISYYNKNRELHRIKDRVKYYVRKYGMPRHEALSRVLEGRLGECEICLQNGDTVVDHNHSTGRTRGLICSSCNSLLGYSRENTDILQATINYLNKYRSLSDGQG